jgi:hypothetical protein
MLEAIKTEYKKIVFRSKSEAIVARCFDIQGILWIYEPDHWKTEDGWVPDFWVILPDKNKINSGFFSICLEYKPSKPTKTYLDKMIKRGDSLGKRLSGHFFGVLFGSPFDDSVGRGLLMYSSEDDPQWRNISGDRFYNRWDEAIKYRFDLQ